MCLLLGCNVLVMRWNSDVLLVLFGFRMLIVVFCLIMKLVWLVIMIVLKDLFSLEIERRVDKMVVF